MLKILIIIFFSRFILLNLFIDVKIIFLFYYFPLIFSHVESSLGIYIFFVHVIFIHEWNILPVHSTRLMAILFFTSFFFFLRLFHISLVFHARVLLSSFFANPRLWKLWEIEVNFLGGDKRASIRWALFFFFIHFFFFLSFSPFSYTVILPHQGGHFALFFSSLLHHLLQLNVLKNQ